jgi:glutamate N-acetyltransferase / amino-acid N-acetyltransferase
LKLPLGYSYAATYAGIRQAEKDDLALIVSGLAANAAAVFTQNRVQAAPVRLGRSHLKASKGLCGAVVINAGNANCATRTGDAVALATCKAAGKLLKLPATQVLPSSTGVIGVELDPRKIIDTLPRLVKGLSGEGFDSVARAIMTTDLVPKTAFAEARLRRGAVRVAGMTKGSGMIQPMMATTLGFVMTDAILPTPQLRAMLKRGVERSYNRISVDGDTSTNDTLLLLANGASGVRPDAKEMAMVEAAITDVMEGLAKQIARDGEGARKFVTIEVTGAADSDGAARIARGIANSPLVKTAIAGSDPNWGRILSAAGNAGVAFDPAKTDIHMQGVAVCKGGLAAPFSEQELKAKLDAAD